MNSIVRVDVVRVLKTLLNTPTGVTVWVEIEPYSVVFTKCGNFCLYWTNGLTFVDTQPVFSLHWNERLQLRSIFTVKDLV